MTRPSRTLAPRTLARMLAAPLAVLTVSLAAPAMADDPAAPDTAQALVVYELFTSQGCSSCPPANAQITRIAERPDALALSYGVTYWDYLGWTDTFAAPEFTERQRDYVRALGARSPYTPQIVVNGTEHGSKVRRGAQAPHVGTDVSLRANGARVVASGAGQAVLVSYTPGTQRVPVARGENTGRTLPITNVVTAIQTVELPHSFAPASGQAYALLQHGEDAQVTSAAKWVP